MTPEEFFRAANAEAFAAGASPGLAGQITKGLDVFSANFLAAIQSVPRADLEGFVNAAAEHLLAVVRRCGLVTEDVTAEQAASWAAGFITALMSVNSVSTVAVVDVADPLEESYRQS